MTTHDDFYYVLKHNKNTYEAPIEAYSVFNFKQKDVAYALCSAIKSLIDFIKKEEGYKIVFNTETYIYASSVVFSPNLFLPVPDEEIIEILRILESL